MAEKTNIRELALEVLLLVERQECKLNQALHAQLLKHQYLTKQDRAFLGRLCEGVMEYRIRLDYVVDSVSKTPISKCKPLIRCLLRMGAYQILFLDGVPDSAACNESVKLAKKRGFARLSGFLNGVLRNLARQKECIVYPDREQQPRKWLSVWYSLPEWLVCQWCDQYGWERAQLMAAASVETAPLVIRRNPLRCLEETLKEVLEQEGISLLPVPVNEAMEQVLPMWVQKQVEDIAARLERVDYLSRYDSFQKGLFTVQDVSSMIPGILAQREIVEKKQREKTPLLVLDMCSAPGGKTAHVAACLDETDCLIARDVSAAKVEKIQENLERLGITNVQTQVQDGREYTKELENQVDVVLLDAPCSGLGVLGRKKDICYSMSLQQQEQLAELQRELLLVAARYVKPGGSLIYSTCTVNCGENGENVEWFLEQRTDFSVGEQYQLLPGVMPLDGFFVAQFRKQKE